MTITRRNLFGFLAVAPIGIPAAIAAIETESERLLSAMLTAMRESSEYCRFRPAPVVPFFHVKLVDTTYMPQLAGPQAIDAYRYVTGDPTS